jgi:hypothetical protein
MQEQRIEEVFLTYANASLSKPESILEIVGAINQNFKMLYGRKTLQDFAALVSAVQQCNNACQPAEKIEILCPIEDQCIYASKFNHQVGCPKRDQQVLNETPKVIEGPWERQGFPFVEDDHPLCSDTEERTKIFLLGYRKFFDLSSKGKILAIKPEYQNYDFTDYLYAVMSFDLDHWTDFSKEENQPKLKKYFQHGYPRKDFLNDCAFADHRNDIYGIDCTRSYGLLMSDN